MYCKRCGAELPEDSNFCPFCGEKAIDTTDRKILNENQIPQHRRRENLTKRKKENSANIVLILLVIVVIVVSFLLLNLKYDLISRRNQEEQVENFSPLPSSMTEQEASPIPTSISSPKPNSTRGFEGLSGLSEEQKNEVLRNFIKNYNPDNTVIESKWSQELIDDKNQLGEDLIKHVIDGTSDLPIETQNQVMMDYIRSIAK